MASPDASAGAGRGAAQSSPPPDDGQQILSLANDLLRSTAITERPIESLDDLRDTASSMFVALFEKLFSVRLGNVVRVPSRAQDYQSNAQVVLDALRKMLPVIELPVHITGQSIVGGNIDLIKHVLSIFRELQRILPEAESGKVGAGGMRKLSIPPSIAEEAAAAAGGSGKKRRTRRPGAKSVPSGAAASGAAAAAAASGGGASSSGGRGSGKARRHRAGGKVGGPREDQGRRGGRRGSTSGAKAIPRGLAARIPSSSVAHARWHSESQRQTHGRRRRKRLASKSDGSGSASGSGSAGEEIISSRDARTSSRAAFSDSELVMAADDAGPGVVHTGIEREVAQESHFHRVEKAAAARGHLGDADALTRLRTAQKRAVRDRFAALRVVEQQFVKRAILRARAADHDRRVHVIRARRLAVELRRESLAYRARRSSLQTSLSTKLVKAALVAERDAAIDAKRAAIAEANEVMQLEMRRWEATQHAMVVRREMLREQDKVQAKERSITMRAQAIAFQQARRDLSDAQEATLEAERDLVRHREERFVHNYIEPLDLQAARGMRGNPQEVLATQSARYDSGRDARAAPQRGGRSSRRPRSAPRRRKMPRRAAWA